jgi:hypothetical protein
LPPFGKVSSENPEKILKKLHFFGDFPVFTGDKSEILWYNKKDITDGKGDEAVTDRYLFGTAVPVLLDGGRSAGRLARMLYTRFGLEAHWFGAKGHLLLSVYARKHRALPFTEENDAVTLRLLRAFAREHGSAAGILALIPCSPEAETFLARAGHELEEDFILLDRPAQNANPLVGLVQSH